MLEGWIINAHKMIPAVLYREEKGLRCVALTSRPSSWILTYPTLHKKKFARTSLQFNLSDSSLLLPLHDWNENNHQASGPHLFCILTICPVITATINSPAKSLLSSKPELSPYLPSNLYPSPTFVFVQTP